MTHERWSLSVPIEEVPLAEHAELARQAEQLGYTDAWSLEVDGTDCFSPLALIGSATRLRLGTAIANVYTRGPATLAMSAAGLAESAPGRFCLGLGAGSLLCYAQPGDAIGPGDEVALFPPVTGG